MEYRDYYKILGVDRSADDKAIKTAYRRLARKHHPDVAKGSAARFQEINEAYEVLSDPEKRKRYDSLGPDWRRYAQTGAGARSPFEGAQAHVRRGGEPGTFSDFFQAVFGDFGLGGGRVRDMRGRGIDLGDLDDLGVTLGSEGRSDVEAAIELTLDEAFRGVRKTISLELDEPCGACGGAGHVARRPCGQCGGSGWARGRRHLEVKIPAGVETGSRVRVPGEGAGGAGKRGDLYLRVAVRLHERFERRGDDLHLDLPVSFLDAALGAEVQVPTLKGHVAMKIPPETSSGRAFRLPGYGMPRVKGGGAGDQYVRVQVTVPAGLGAREKELLREIQRLRSEMPG